MTRLQALGCEKASVFSFDLDRQELWARVNEDVTIRIPLGSGVAGKCAELGQTLNIPDAYACKYFNRSGDQKTGGWSGADIVTMIVMTTTAANVELPASSAPITQHDVCFRFRDAQPPDHAGEGR